MKLLRESSVVWKRRLPQRWVKELIEAVPWKRAVVLTKKPQTTSWPALVPSDGATDSRSAPRPKRLSAKRTGTTMSKRFSQTSSGYLVRSRTLE